jgi:hypothetical protein
MTRNERNLPCASLAQSVEQRIRNAWVVGSSPMGSFIRKALQLTGCRAYFLHSGGIICLEYIKIVIKIINFFMVVCCIIIVLY